MYASLNTVTVKVTLQEKEKARVNFPSSRF